ncbi:MAG TPA: NifU family protein [Gemmatimonadales bacterium]|nr:NifU family protein [Gemmatimonadales bacterium]
MGAGLSDREVRSRVARVEALLAKLEETDDGPARAAAMDALQGLVELYGEALARLVAQVSRECGAETVARLAGDELVGHLLLVHDLHPLELESRVRQALEEVRPYLRSHGGNVELLGVDAEVAHVRLEGSCHGCPSSAVTLRQAVEEAVRKAAPELTAVVQDGAGEDELPAVSQPALVQLTARAASGTVA